MEVRCNKATALCRIEKCPHAKVHERKWYEHSSSQPGVRLWLWCTQWDWCDWRELNCRCTQPKED